ncbi:Protein TolB [compost metagenome]
MRVPLRRMIHSVGIGMLVIVMGCSSSKNEIHPYASQEPMNTARSFLPDIVNTDLIEEMIAFSPDGQTMYFSRLSLEQLRVGLYFSNFKNGQWSAPEKVPFSIKDRNDLAPFMSSDGKRLFFISDRRTETESTTSRVRRIWYVDKEGNDWGEPQIAKGIPAGELSISENNNVYVAVFSGNSEYIYKMKWTEDQFEKPVKLSSAINNPDYLNTIPYIAPDESFLVFGRYTQSPETYEMYVSYNRDGEWSEAEKLSETINESGYFSYAGTISPDGKYLFFAKGKPWSTRSNIDIYQLDLKEAGIQLATD